MSTKDATIKRRNSSNDWDIINPITVGQNIYGSGANYTTPLLNSSDKIDDAFINKELFWATYGTTTYAQITNAVSAGKLPVVKYNGITYTYSKDWGSSLGHLFGTMDANYDRWVYCKQNSTWGTGYMEVENSTNKVNALTSSSTTTQYPNAKVVYDTFQTKANTTDLPQVKRYI